MTNEELKTISKNLEEHLSLFSDAEMERDQKTYCTFRPSELHDTKESIDELLALRSMRDAGEEDLSSLRAVVMYGISADGTRDAPIAAANVSLAKICQLFDIRGQQLREAKEEIERLKKRVESENGFAIKAGKMIDELTSERDAARKEIERLKEKCEHKSQQVDSQVSLVSEMQFQIASITEENKRLRDEAEVSDSLVLTLQEEVKTLTAERDESRKEVAELRSAPGMEEVDFITKPYCGQSMQSACENHDKLASIARRAIASREEVVGLLKWLTENSEDWKNFAFLVEEDSTEHLGKVRRILEIVEGKEHGIPARPEGD